MVLHCCKARCNHGVLFGYLPAHHVVAESFSISVCDLFFNYYCGFEISISVIVVGGDRVNSPGAL